MQSAEMETDENLRKGKEITKAETPQYLRPPYTP